MRVGHGFDAHRFAKDRPLILGGVSIPYAFGLEAHSDGDAVIHALCDALLGAAALGDIGQHFPDTDNEFSNIDSRILLRKIVGLLDGKNYVILNADITVVAQAPRLAEYIPEMKKILAEDMRINPDQVNIKATTTEKMGYIGRKEGIEVHSLVLINMK